MTTITNLIYALLIPFSCGVGVQRLLAIMDALFAKAKPATKAWISALISFVVGLLIAWLADIRVLAVIADATNKTLGGECPKCVDVIVTALIVSAGTEGFNSIIKFLGYAKEQKKANAVESLRAQTGGQANSNALGLVHS